MHTLMATISFYRLNYFCVIGTKKSEHFVCSDRHKIWRVKTIGKETGFFFTPDKKVQSESNFSQISLSVYVNITTVVGTAFLQHYTSLLKKKDLN